MKNGPAIFAWTWFNKIGNREMYMVCSPIEVVGGTDDSTFVDSLPPIFRANIPGECITGASGSVINFPEPGDFGRVMEQGTPGSEGTCEKGVEPNFKDDGAVPEKPEPSAPVASGAPSSAQPSSPSVSVQPSVTVQPSSPAGPSAPASSVVQSPAPSSLITTTTVNRPVQPTSIIAPINSTNPEPPASTDKPFWAGEDYQACPAEIQSGMLYCFSETTWGICNQGWAYVSAVAPGTKCINGLIS
jgi:hypothetical protein